MIIWRFLLRTKTDVFHSVSNEIACTILILAYGYKACSLCIGSFGDILLKIVGPFETSYY